MFLEEEDADPQGRRLCGGGGRGGRDAALSPDHQRPAAHGGLDAAGEESEL